MALMGRRASDAEASLFSGPPSEVELVQRQIEQRINTPLTSSAGRLFDAVAALLGVREVISYEAQAAIELEMLSLDAGSHDGQGGYPFVLTKRDGTGILEMRDLFEGILADLAGGRAVPEIGWRFHLSLAEMIVQTCRWLALETGLQVVALSGGCFQNRLLLEMTAPALVEAGFRVLLHRQVPCNDGGLSLGQAVVAGLSIGAAAR